MAERNQPKTFGEVEPKRKLVPVVSGLKTSKVAVAAFVGGVVAYLVWILIHKLLAAVGMSDIMPSGFFQAQVFGAGDAIAAGIAAGAGGAATVQTYKLIDEDQPLGIHSNPPNGGGGG
jgi:hypothetical protein